MIRNYTEKYAEIWETCSKQLPVFCKKYSRSGKLQKEQTLDQFLKTIKSFRKDRINHQSISEAKQSTFLRNTRAFLCDGLDFTNDQLELMFSDNMISITRSFVRQAKAFDSELSFNDIFQACRNMWIMNGLQLVMGIPMRVTP